ncbi:MAG: tetratricopeptide repeat protein, partial [Muribaculaceae bacterium]|nr:tetratricopeptide repeat protein [Muribaculaceae bacterium]
YAQSPMLPYARLLIGSDYFYKGDYKQTLVAFAKLDSLSLDVRTRQDLDYRKALSQLVTGDYASAEPALERLKSSDAYGKAARFYLAYAAYASKDYDKALLLMDDVDKTVLPGSMADYYLAQIYYARRDFAKALDVAQPLTDAGRDVRPEFMLEACRVTGESMFELGRDEEAGKYLQRYVAGCANPLPSTRYVLGVIDYRGAHYADALTQLRPVADEENAIGQSANLLIGQCYVKDGDTRSALLAFRKASDMEFDSSVAETALYNYAVTSLQGAREPFGSTVNIFHDFISRYPRSSYAPKVEEYLISGYITDNDYDSALKSINGISNPSKDVLAAKQRVLFVMGTRKYSSGDYKGALSYFDQAAKLASYNSSIAIENTLWRGECLYRLGDYVKAEQAFRTYMSKAPKSALNHTQAAYDLGYALYSRKKYADARTQFQKVISDRKTDAAMKADAHNRVADTYYYTSDFSKAATHYDEAYRLNPSAGDYALYRHALMNWLSRNHK